MRTSSVTRTLRRGAVILASGALLAALSPARVPPALGQEASNGISPGARVRVGPGRGGGERQVDPSRGAGDTRASDEPSAERALEGADDQVLRVLREAERDLFPRARSRAYPALERELPMSVEPLGPVLHTSGLPLAAAASSPRRSAASRAWPRGLNLPDLPVSMEQRTLDYLEFYRDSARGRAIAAAWVRKAGRYAPAIQAELIRLGLPRDLVWLSLVESSHNLVSRSRAGAVGLWQFIADTARLYGLTVDRWVDERMDPVRSTRAAAEYLRDLERRFGSWELAMAAYNMGQGGLLRVIRKYNTNDFWRLSRLEAALPWETALYVPKVVATAILMKNRRIFGLDAVEPDPPVSFDTIQVPAGVPLARIAAEMGVPESTLIALNPQYLKGRTPPARADEARQHWPVHVPVGQGANITRVSWQGTPPADGDASASYRVRWGDSVGTIARRLHGSEAELRAYNRVEPGERLDPGCLLLIPAAWEQTDQTRALAPLDDTESVAVVPPFRFHYPDRERVFYRVQPGDDLNELAAALQVRPLDLVAWNGLDPRAHVQAEMMLQVFVPRGARLEGVRVTPEAQLGRELEVGTREFFAHFESERGRQRLRILARAGETLESIGRRYGLSGGMMERINHFARGRRLREGFPVVVYVKDGTTATEALWSRAPDPLPPVAPPFPAALP